MSDRPECNSMPRTAVTWQKRTLLLVKHTTIELQVMKHGYRYELAMEHTVYGRRRLHLGSRKGGQTKHEVAMLITSSGM